MRPQRPAKGIMLENEVNEAKSYHVECACGSSDHSVKMWIEVDNDIDCVDIQVSFYADMWTPWWGKYYNRFKCIWQLLTTGIIRYEHHMLLKEQEAVNFASVILSDVKKLGERKKNVTKRKLGSTGKDTS